MPDVTVRHGPDSEPEPGRGHAPERPPGAGSGPPYDGVLLTALVARLREAGLDPDAEQLCDAIWLAQQTSGGRTSDGGAEGAEGITYAGSEPAGPGPLSVTRPGEQDRTGEDGPADEPLPRSELPDPDRRIALHPVPRDDGPRIRSGGASAALTLGVPAAPALPAPLELQRALRPLQRYRPAAPPLRRTLDEVATVELSARAGGLIIPVFRGVSRADALLQFVMDTSSSMRVWERLFGELQQIFGQLGAFRDVQVRYLHQGPDGAPAVSRSPDPAAAPLSSADRLSDPTGRRVTVVVSDCAGPLWHSGRAHRLLHQLGRQAPTAVLQPLPQRMWNRTRLPVTYGVLSRGEGLAGAAVLKVGDETAPGQAAHPGALAIPVLPPVAGALGAWARLLSGTGAGRISGAVGWVRADHPAAPPQRPGDRMSSLQLVSRFRSAASPVAGQLAVYLAAAPLYLPVMQLVQRTMLPDSGPSELAEVLLSGLLSRGKSDSADDGPWYEFAPGVQEALLGPLGRDEAMLVLKHCSEYIEQRFGRGGPNFPALALAQLGDGSHGPLFPRGGLDDDGPFGAHGADGIEPGESGEPGADGQRVPHPFAEVAARVLERFMPLPEQFTDPDAGGPGPEDRTTNAAVESARDLLRQFESDGMVQYLIDAVQQLRGATEREAPGAADPELWAETARCLLRLWEVQGGGELLREAIRAAERAAAHPRAVRERAVLAQVLHAAADDRRRRGDRPGALELLRRADREYAFACAAPGLEPGEALRLTLERVRALEAQWRLGGDSALLQGAIGMLEAFADVWPDQENRPAGLPLAHGRTLLRLSGATGDTEQAQVYATQAARSLRKALSPGSGAHTVSTQARILLDLVDALLRSGEGLDEAGTLIEQSLATVRDERLRASLRARAGRVCLARYERSGDPADLEEAAECFARAARGTARDSRAHADLLAEWGGALLRRAELPDGAPFTGAAVRVLRDCRTETVTGTARQAERLLMLGRALMLRHRLHDDRVDLREAEHLFGLAAQEASEPLTEARCWLELGRSHLDAYRTLHRPARLDDAAEAFRDAADAARTAEEELESPRLRLQAVALRAEANHWRGMTYERAGRPRAAREAYRAARTEWRKLPDGGGGTAGSTMERLAELER
ncbi:SAV_2336 N-terminal domain-related protein [Streptomyces lushanensis]|uniref:SAV_2336 N-terminal domain-related protein n=1 Tax=Streptomyces lushanensis TaxID=1434255 RepID=UPI000832A97B|nr:SAV_2336 N-terminal domain-related protein [Streptomyces lushanensis]